MRPFSPKLLSRRLSGRERAEIPRDIDEIAKGDMAAILSPPVGAEQIPTLLAIRPGGDIAARASSLSGQVAGDLPPDGDAATLKRSVGPREAVHGAGEKGRRRGEWGVGLTAPEIWGPQPSCR